MAYKEGTELFQELQENLGSPCRGVIPEGFPIEAIPDKNDSFFELEQDIKALSDTFNRGGKRSPFKNRGVMVKGKVRTLETHSTYDGPFQTLGSILQKGSEVPSSYYIGEKEYRKWAYLKGSKREERRSASGHTYVYSEGRMVFPDPLDQPSRTIITAEGGASPSRFKHVVDNGNGLRRLTPIELERLNMFPDGHTALEGVTENQRAFLMGNALVVGIVTRLGKALKEALTEESKVGVGSSD